MVRGGERWWHGSYKEMAAVEWSIRKHNVGVGLGAKKHRTELLWLGFRSAMLNGDSERW